MIATFVSNTSQIYPERDYRTRHIGPVTHIRNRADFIKHRMVEIRMITSYLPFCLLKLCGSVNIMMSCMFAALKRVSL